MSVQHHRPSDKATLPPKLSSKVVGLTFAAGYPQNLHRLDQLVKAGRGPTLAIVRDPENAHDANAVAVRSAATGRHLGHLPAALAGRIAPEIDGGTEWAVAGYQVLVMPGHEDHPGLQLELERTATQ